MFIYISTYKVRLNRFYFSKSIFNQYIDIFDNTNGRATVLEDLV